MMEIKSLVDLKQLGKKYGTDKVSNGYLPFYEKLFEFFFISVYLLTFFNISENFDIVLII